MPEPAVARPWPDREALWVAYRDTQWLGLSRAEELPLRHAFEAGWAAREQTETEAPCLEPLP